MRATATLTPLILVLLGGAANASATDFFVDPINGSQDGDGSMEHPWHTLAEVFQDHLVETRVFESQPYEEGLGYVTLNAGAPIHAGDTIWLADGYHGQIALNGAHNAEMITVAGLPGHHPELGGVHLVAASNWTFDHLSISPSYGELSGRDTIVLVESHSWNGPSSHITLSNNEIFYSDDTAGWDVLDWEYTPANAVELRGDNMHVYNNDIHDVFHGIMLYERESSATHNRVNRFGADGIRVLGDNSEVAFNEIRNALGGNNPLTHNHDDGIQSWSRGLDAPHGAGLGRIDSVWIHNNLVVHLDDPDNPARGSYFQGLGFFDGFYDHFTIENNVIFCDASHGISLYGAEDTRILNNSILSIDAGEATTPADGVPSIQIHPHKDGRPSTRNTVRNNIAHGFSLSGGATEDHNLTIPFTSTEHFNYFVNPVGYDLHLAEGSPAIDAGAVEYAPLIDNESGVRPVGGAFDVGAFEYGAPSSGEAPGLVDSPQDGPTYPPGGTPEDTGDTGAQEDTDLADTSDDDTTSGDTSVADTGIADTGIADTGIADTGIADTGIADTNDTETTNDDTTNDADTNDTETTNDDTTNDTGDDDTGDDDTTDDDTGGEELGVDTSGEDPGVADTALTDSGAADVHPPLDEVTNVDSGQDNPAAGDDTGCSCVQATPSSNQGLGLLGLSIFAVLRRRR